MKAEATASQNLWRAVIGRVCVLTAILLVVLIPAGWLGYDAFGLVGLEAAVLAGLVCWIASTAALFLTAVLRGPQTGAQGILLASLFRMGLPMGFGALLMTQGGPIAAAGGLKQLLAFYLISLVAETLLAVPLVQQNSAPASASDMAVASEN